MGKKKSKIAKKKQAKQAQASRKFGVLVKKGTGGREQSLQVVMNHGDNAKQNKRNGKKYTVKSKFVAASPSKTLSQKAARNEEHDDFTRQMASAQERQEAKQLNTKKKKAQQAQVSFKPATLIVDDKHKCTSRLMQETTTHLASGLNGIGNTVQRSTLSLAAYASSGGWTTDSNTNHDETSTLESDNPYAALDNGDDSDEEQQLHQELMEAPTLPLFRLAPPSFAINGSNGINDDDVDPDL